MKKEEFEKLLSFLKLTLDEKSKKAMSPGDKLAVFLLFASGIFQIVSNLYLLILGMTMSRIAAITNYGVSTVRKTIRMVSNNIIECLEPLFLCFPESEEEWKEVSHCFEVKTGLPNCCGAIGGINKWHDLYFILDMFRRETFTNSKATERGLSVS